MCLVGVVTNQTFGAARYKGVLLQARQVKCASNTGLPNATIQSKCHTSISILMKNV